MNYLAHLYLAPDRPAALAGNFLGDFVKGPLPRDWPEDLVRGMAQHRRVDTVTDRHPAFRASRQRLPREWRRYAGLLIDLWYDHLLAARWAGYSEEPLETFSARAEAAIAAYRRWLPAGPGRERVDGILAARVLEAYGDPAVAARALGGIGRRLRRPVDLAAAVPVLEAQNQALAADLEALLPDLARAVAELEPLRPGAGPG